MCQKPARNILSVRAALGIWTERRYFKCGIVVSCIYSAGSPKSWGAWQHFGRERMGMGFHDVHGLQRPTNARTLLLLWHKDGWGSHHKGRLFHHLRIYATIYDSGLGGPPLGQSKVCFSGLQPRPPQAGYGSPPSPLWLVLRFLCFSVGFVNDFATSSRWWPLRGRWREEGAYRGREGLLPLEGRGAIPWT